MKKPILLMALSLNCLGQAVTVNPATTYQTHGHVAVTPYARNSPNGVLIFDPLWTNVQANFSAQLANQLGVDTVCFFLSGWYPPNPTYNGLSIVTYLNDYWAGSGGLKAAIQAAGRTPHIALIFGSGSAGPPSSSTVYANTMLNSLQALSTAGYSVDFVSAANEPDINGWTTTQLGNDLAAGVAALNGAGYFPTIVCCDTNTYSNALTWYDAVKAIVGTGVIGAISSHDYGNYGAATYMQAVAAQAASDGIQSWMTEYFNSGVTDIFTILQNANASGFMRGLDARSSVTANPPPGDACSYLSVTQETPTYQSSYTLGTESPPTNQYYYSCVSTEPPYFQAQIFGYIPQGSIRESATVTGGSNWNAIAYSRPGTQGHVVIVQSLATGSQTVTVTGVPAGTYGCTWTTGNSALLQSCAANQTIGGGGTLTATKTIPSPPSNSPTTAVFTFFAIPNPPSIGTIGIVNAGVAASGIN